MYMDIRNWIISGIKVLLNVYINRSNVYNINWGCINESNKFKCSCFVLSNQIQYLTHSYLH